MSARALAAALAALGAACAAPSTARAQSAEAVGEEHLPPRRGNAEFGALVLASAGYGLRTGAAINGLFGRAADDGAPETFWILPGILGAGLLTGAVLLDHRWPLRRGRPFAMGTSILLGYIGSLAIVMQTRDEPAPSARSLTGPATWIGSTAGLVTGALVGHFTDARPGQALYVGTGSVGGAILGTLLCGALRCGSDLGLWAITGESVGLAVTLATVNALNPPAREMRLTAIGGVLGALPAAGVLAAYARRDGAVAAYVWPRVSAVALAGLVVGGVSGYAIARSTRPAHATAAPTLSFAPMIDPTGGASVMGFTASGEL